MSVIDFNEYLKTIISAGQAIEGNVVKIIADNGREIGDAVYKVIDGGNGTASQVAVATQTGAAGAVTTGVAYMAIDVGVWGAALAPCLGVAVGAGVGYGLYNIDPQFWVDLSDALFEAGYTINGKVLCFWNGVNAYMEDGSIEIFKNLLSSYGVFADDQVTGYVPESSEYDLHYTYTYPVPISYAPTQCFNYNGYYITLNAQYTYIYRDPSVSNQVLLYGFSRTDNMSYYNSYDQSITSIEGDHIVIDEDDWYATSIIINNADYAATLPYFRGLELPNDKRDMILLLLYNDLIDENDSGIPLQKGAIYPNPETEFPLIYPKWDPFNYPQTLPDPSELPTVYPVKYPGTNPDPYPDQDPAQNPDPEPAPSIYPEIMPDLDLPDPNPDPEPSPEPEPDPDPQPADQPETIPDNPPDPGPDPIDPNPDPPPSPAIPVPGLPSTVTSNKLFTVYNPSSSILDSLGGYLWDSSIIASIRDIWQDPLDGIISLIQVYATPTTSGNHNIILGFLDTNISCPVVSSQFITIDCGSVTVPEKKKNATDYAPYTSLHLYLPFIGIVELDTNECMNSTISVTYKVDVYTGTCLATISINRATDMPNAPILYTYSGNCSQQIPLTSGNATGVLSALIGGITAGLSVASGGGLGVLAGAQIAGQSLTHEMFHVSHSGNISANAGIMGQKKPYLIIGRRHGYDANGYNTIYGYPSNNTVVLGNHTGYVKVKKCYVKTSATQPEYEEIMQLLQNGVIL